MEATTALPVKLVTSIISNSDEITEAVIEELKEKYGSFDYISDRLAFDHTDYYGDEMGRELSRYIISFRELIDPGKLAEVKLFTNALEANFSVEGKRSMNIDPGYVTLERLVLASCKNFSHRVYLASGVYAELTLLYKGRSFMALPWSYPEYTREPILTIMNNIRTTYHKEMNGRGL
ncbi:MAG: DUF4416 family protein [Deltaproteobacteria bacterium]|nr:DUF4416 family protein [Deltaproteobacteria bacterium]